VSELSSNHWLYYSLSDCIKLLYAVGNSIHIWICVGKQLVAVTFFSKILALVAVVLRSLHVCRDVLDHVIETWKFVIGNGAVACCTMLILRAVYNFKKIRLASAQSLFMA
jgi:hypothetical protein